MSRRITLDFVVCGVQKAGTTSLDKELRQHPQICMANRKELHFFDDDALFASHAIPDDSLAAFYPDQADGRILGESTPVYIYWPACLERLHAHNPKMKTIVLLRNPIDRAYSHWQMESRRGNEFQSFEVATRREREILNRNPDFHHRVNSYLARGLYGRQLQRLWTVFAPSQTLLVNCEEHWQHRKESLARIFKFLDVDSDAVVAPAHEHRAQAIGGVDGQLRVELAEFFRADLDALRPKLPWDCSEWLL